MAFIHFRSSIELLKEREDMNQRSLTIVRGENHASEAYAQEKLRN